MLPIPRTTKLTTEKDCVSPAKDVKRHNLVVLFDMSGTNGLQTATPTSNYFQPTLGKTLERYRYSFWEMILAVPPSSRFWEQADMEITL